MTLSNTDDQIKAGPRPESGMSQADCSNAVEKLARTIGQLPINPTAKLVAFVMRSTRIIDTKVLAQITGLSMRVVQKSKNEYATARDEAGELGFAEQSECSEQSEPGFANRTNPANQDSLSPAPRVHAPAQMELPSEVLPTKVVKDIPPLPPKGPSKVDCLEAFTAFNDTALRCALPQAAKLTKDRERKIGARLKEYGLEGWKQALANIEKSKFLTGRTDHGFRATLDFMLQSSSFGRLHDGGYSNGKDTKAAAPLKKVSDQFSERAAREYWAQVDGLIQ